jgi:hypothetical protein
VLNEKKKKWFSWEEEKGVKNKNRTTIVSNKKSNIGPLEKDKVLVLRPNNMLWDPSMLKVLVLRSV